MLRNGLPLSFCSRSRAIKERHELMKNLTYHPEKEIGSQKGMVFPGSQNWLKVGFVPGKPCDLGSGWV